MKERIQLKERCISYSLDFPFSIHMLTQLQELYPALLELEDCTAHCQIEPIGKDPTQVNDK